MKRHNRRTFLKCSGAAALSAAWPGHAGLSGSPSAPGLGAGYGGIQEIRVKISAPDDPLVVRVFTILQDRIEQRCIAKAVLSDADAQIILAVGDGLAPEVFRIEESGSTICLTGGTARGLLYAVGKFLRTSRYEGMFQPSLWRGVSTPGGAVRGMYFATHFHNWHHQASPAEIARYMEDLALWGVNAVMAVFPMINLQGWDDPEASPALDMLRQYAKTARKLGLQFVTGLNNTMFIGAPKEIRAVPLPDPTHRRGNSGHPICPSHPDGHAYLMANADRLFRELSEVGLDLLCLWPYDEGGCACANCLPWGSNGYLRLSRDLAQLGRTHFPALKTILSTWMFDTPPEGEWQGLSDILSRDGGWVDYILADAHEDFPRYPLDTGVPGGKPLLNFPEISMWGNWPWGGVGANPLPVRLQRLWDQVKHVVEGGFPYSEGIYEDMNKAVAAQFYWDRDKSARATIEEYAAYEFGAGVVSEVVSLVDILESTASNAFMKQPVNTDEVRRGAAMAAEVQLRMPEWARRNWRWEILHLRAILDQERFAGGGLKTPPAEAAMTRLMELYHCQMETDDPYHHRVRPPLGRAVSRRGES